MLYYVLGLNFLGLVQNFEKKNAMKFQKNLRFWQWKKNTSTKLTLTWAGDLHVATGSRDENTLFCLLFIL